MMEQVKDREHAKIKKVLIEVCCGETSKLSSAFKEKGGEAIRIYLPNHNMLKRHTIKALKLTIEDLKQEDFEVKIWISIPCSPWCSWQRVNLKTVPNFEERLKEMRDESLILVGIGNVKELVEESKCESYFEWPKNNDGWKNPTVEELLKNMPYSTEFDGCAYGLKNSEGKAMKKIWKVVSGKLSLPMIGSKNMYMKHVVALKSMHKSEEKMEKQLKSTLKI
jgi:predicted adenine nucleotide alpha hydrolase (AANH) superfamily ATPase